MLSDSQGGGCVSPISGDSEPEGTNVLRMLLELFHVSPGEMPMVPRLVQRMGKRIGQAVPCPAPSAGQPEGLTWGILTELGFHLNVSNTQFQRNGW